MRKSYSNETPSSVLWKKSLPIYRITFLTTLGLQLIGFVFYLFLGLNRAGGHNTLVTVYQGFYRPAIAVTMSIQNMVGTRSWGAFGFLLLWSPLLGAFAYSFVTMVMVAVCHHLAARRKWMKAASDNFGRIDIRF